MDYEKKYKEALERARELSKTTTGANYEYIFPELAESEDERIRKWLIADLKDSIDSCAYCERTKPQALEAIAWLEKQGEQKLVLDELEMTLSVSEDAYLRSNLEKLIKELKGDEQ